MFNLITRVFVLVSLIMTSFNSYATATAGVSGQANGLDKK